MQLDHIDSALKDGCHLVGFCPATKLRVVRVLRSRVEVGYGEHPHIQDALSHLNEDIAAGGRDYDEVYGKIKPCYITGSLEASSTLDDWLIQDERIYARGRRGGGIIFSLRRYDGRVYASGVGPTFDEAMRVAVENSIRRSDAEAEEWRRLNPQEIGEVV